MSNQIVADRLLNHESLSQSNQVVTQSSSAVEADVINTPKSLQDSYLFIRQLGKGAQAKVFLAVRLSDGKNVAIKQLNIESVKNWKEYDLFHRESKLLESLNIQGVAKFYEAIECLDDKPPCSYIVQEYIEGVPLGQMIKDGHRFKLTEICDIILQLLDILYQLQNQPSPVIHRDIKPSNILIDPGVGSYKATLIDFGAVANPQVQGGGSTVAGTFGYMPPEQMMGKPVPASDVYSLAAVAVQLFTGKSPGDMPTKDFHLIFEPDMEQFPHELIATLRAMLEPKVEERLADLNELIDRFSKYKNNQFSELSGTAAVNAKNIVTLYEKLKLVRSIGEVGNMDLWQSLPDDVPRVLPESLISDIKYEFNETELQKTHNQSDKSPSRVLQNLGMWLDIQSFNFVFVIFFLIIGIPIGIYFILSFWFSPTTSVVIVFIGLFIFFGYFATPNDEDSEESGRQYSMTSHIQRAHDNRISNREVLLNILINGRKTIATITDVRYIPTDDNVIAIHGLQICRSLPQFMVKYKFNPPDDSKGDVDIIHSCIVNSAPEERYKIGDPLPILYLLDNHYSVETLASIPFPFAYDDLDANNLVTVDKNYIKKTHTINSNNVINRDNRYILRYILPSLLNSVNDYHKLHTLFENGLDFSLTERSERKLLTKFIVEILQSGDESMHYMAMKYLVRERHWTSGVGSVYNFLSSYLDGKDASMTVTRGGVGGLVNSDKLCKYPVRIQNKILDILLDSSKSAVFDSIVDGYCKLLYSNLENSEIVTNRFVNYFDQQKSDCLSPDPAIVSALLCNNHFRECALNDEQTVKLHENKHFVAIWQAMMACYDNVLDVDDNQFISDCLKKIMSDKALSLPGFKGLFNIDMLYDYKYMAIYPLIAEFMCRTENLDFLEFLTICQNSGSLNKGVMMGIAYYTRWTYTNNDSESYYTELFRILLDMYKSLTMNDDRINAWFPGMMTIEDWDSDNLNRCIANFPLSLASAVFNDKDLNHYYPSVFASINQIDSVPIFLDTIKSYFLSRDLRCDVSTHIAVFEAVAKKVSKYGHRWSGRYRLRFQNICDDIRREAAPELEAFVSDYLENPDWQIDPYLNDSA